MSTSGWAGGCHAATRAWCAARSNPAPAKFTGRLMAWYTTYVAVNSRKGESARSAVSSLSWLTMRQIEPIRITVVRYGRFRWM